MSLWQTTCSLNDVRCCRIVESYKKNILRHTKKYWFFNLPNLEFVSFYCNRKLYSHEPIIPSLKLKRKAQISSTLASFRLICHRFNAPNIKKLTKIYVKILKRRTLFSIFAASNHVNGPSSRGNFLSFNWFFFSQLIIDTTPPFRNHGPRLHKPDLGEVV